jgi:hypothetical protein
MAAEVPLERWHWWWKQYGSRELRDLLMLWWDPIGVYGVPEARDEYDSYVGRVAELLRTGGSVADVGALLHDVVTDRMGIPDTDDTPAAAARVTDWYERSMSRVGSWRDGSP